MKISPNFILLLLSQYNVWISPTLCNPTCFPLSGITDQRCKGRSHCPSRAHRKHQERQRKKCPRFVDVGSQGFRQGVYLVESPDRRASAVPNSNSSLLDWTHTANKLETTLKRCACVFSERNLNVGAIPSVILFFFVSVFFFTRSIELNLPE